MRALTDDTAGFRTLWAIKNAMIAILILTEYLIIVYQLIMKYKVAMTEASSKMLRNLGTKKSLYLPVFCWI